jgi:hypothetical protein
LLLFFLKFDVVFARSIWRVTRVDALSGTPGNNSVYLENYKIGPVIVEHYVDHEGKEHEDNKNLVVSFDFFVLHSPDEPWKRTNNRSICLEDDSASHE